MSYRVGLVDRLPVDSVRGSDQHRLFLTTALATRREKQLALAIATLSFFIFLVVVPFARTPLLRMPAFIPSYELALFFIDLITAVLLFDQCVRLRSIGILFLASGYLFDALIIIPHALTFPGAFALTGLLGAKDQTTAWLYVFWHGGFPLFVMAYALFRHREESGRPPSTLVHVGWPILGAIVGTVVLTIVLTLFATWRHDWLPIVMQGGDYSLLVRKGISPAVWGLTLLAMVALRRREQRVVDLWLMLVMGIWLLDIALAAVIGSSRFDLGFYAGRIFGLFAASFLLTTLVIEMAQMYAGALGAVASAEKCLAELSRARRRVDVKGVSQTRGESTESFIHHQNIAHYRSLLESDSLDDDRRRLIEGLLSEEETKTK